MNNSPIIRSLFQKGGKTGKSSPFNSKLVRESVVEVANSPVFYILPFKTEPN